MLNIDKISSFNVSIFIIKNIYYVISYLDINCLTIYRVKYLGIVALKVLQTSCFRYNSEEKSAKFPVLEMKQKRTDVSFPVQVLL